MVWLVDSHCHIDIDQFDQDRAEVMARARAAGVGLMVIPGIDLEQNRRALVLAESHADVYVAVGVHPNSSAEPPMGWLEEVRRLAAHPKVVAIGEIGLDYYWREATPEQQAAALWAQLGLAAELGLPVIIHCREAYDDVAAVLSEWAGRVTAEQPPLAARPFWGVLHAFGGEMALAEAAYGWNFVLGLGGPVTFKNARRLHEVAVQARLDRLMLETDAPYLTPHPRRGKRNEPAYTRLVAERLAELRGCTVDEVAATTTATALRFYGVEQTVGVETRVETNVETRAVSGDSGA